MLGPHALSNAKADWIRTHPETKIAKIRDVTETRIRSPFRFFFLPFPIARGSKAADSGGEECDLLS